MSEGMERLRGGVAVVTGAASGIGEGIARAAAECGMAVVLADVAEARLNAVASDLHAQGHETLAVIADVTDQDQVDALARTTFARFGRTTLLVNNVAIGMLGYSWEVSAEDWRRTLDVNIMGFVHGLRAFVPRMLESGAPGWIANLSSIGGLGMAPLHATYMLGKHAVLALTESLALEMALKRAPISVSAVLPGPVASRIFEDASIVGDDMFVRDHHKSMLALLREHGLPSIEAGRRILAQVAAGAFWVSPHPEMLEQVIDRRVAVLRARSQPRLSPELAREVEALRGQ